MTPQTSAARASSLDRLRDVVSQYDCTVEQVCGELARLFHVRPHEVALLYLNRSMLQFLYPVELRSAGAIPITSSAVAARTVTNRRADLFNNFSAIQHSSIFETVKLGTSEIPNAPMDPQAIQKMMTAPVLDSHNKASGVLQISRKGFSLAEAGRDFTPVDLNELKRAAQLVGTCLHRLASRISQI